MQPRLGCISAKRACQAVLNRCSLVLCGCSKTSLTFCMTLRTFALSDFFSSSRMWIGTLSDAESSQFSLAAASFSAAVLRFLIYLNVEWVTASSVPDFIASWTAFAKARIYLSCVRSALRNILFLCLIDCPICILKTWPPNLCFVRNPELQWRHLNWHAYVGASPSDFSGYALALLQFYHSY